jgi:heme exporter protein D
MCIAIWAIVLEERRYRRILKEEREKRVREKRARESLAQHGAISSGCVTNRNDDGLCEE